VSWVAELPSVLWSLRTTPSRATGFTPFFMVHGSEAVLPTDIDYGSPRVRAYTEEGIKSRSRMRSTNSTSRATWHCCGVPSTNRRCDATTSVCAHASSTSATSCSDKFKAARTGTSCRHLGRGCSSSMKCSDQGCTRSSTRTAGSSPTHGISSNCARFTLEQMFKTHESINRCCILCSQVSYPIFRRKPSA
jgi:hypothetical protein